MKKKTIYILIVISVILLLTNVVVNWLNKKEPAQKDREEKISVIDSLFNNTISKFNLDSTWIKSIPINSSQYDSLKMIYRIQLPNDLRPAVVLLELKNTFQDLPLKLVSDEKIVNAQTTLNILSNDKLKLQATFSVENEFERKHAKFSFILTNFSGMDFEKREELYYSIIPFSVLLNPSSESDSLIGQLFEFKKTYSILIEDGIEDDNYKLEAGLSKTRLKESVRYISWNYPSAELFIINDKSNLFSSAIFNFIQDEFSLRKIKLHIMNDLIAIPPNTEEAESLMKFYLESSVGEKGKIILIDAGIFNQLLDLLNTAKQKGAKFYSPIELEKSNSTEELVN